MKITFTNLEQRCTANVTAKAPEKSVYIGSIDHEDRNYKIYVVPGVTAEYIAVENEEQFTDFEKTILDTYTEQTLAYHKYENGKHIICDFSDEFEYDTKKQMFRDILLNFSYWLDLE